MGNETISLLARIATLLEQLVDAEKDDAKRLETISQNLVVINQRLDSIERQKQTSTIDRGDIRNIIEGIIKRDDNLQVSVKGNLSLKKIIVIAGAAISTISGWLWHFIHSLPK